jgi:hypothetical protein
MPMPKTINTNCGSENKYSGIYNGIGELPFALLPCEI